MLAIKNNLMAENAARHLGRSYEALAKSVERLSSGLRINSAKDDAAGLAVRELLRADIAVVRQGSRNASDAISMIQAGEGSMSVMDELLVRMKELAEQAATDSYSDTQRGIMNSEFGELADEITRIAQSTTFNGKTLLNSTDSFDFHVGSSTAISITAQEMTRTGLGLDAAGGTKSTALNYHGVADAGATWFTVGANGAAYTLDFGTEADITGVAFTASTAYSMNEVVTVINARSQAIGTYNAATIEYDSDVGQYFLRTTASATGAVGTMTITKTGTDDIDDLKDVADWNLTDGTAGGAGVAIDSKANAILALTSLDTAIGIKDGYRAELGYLMTRLQATVTVLDIQAENLLAAESRISDADVAAEMSAMTRNQVLAQAGISMLGQANTMPQMALQLLRA
ncbi:MAG TPA: flagellin [Phycisphaerae bacterium]|nr:flagellin [Phycisphaerae bacterium]HUT59974.1 flagellin [Phycisphaerae bacterium]